MNKLILVMALLFSATVTAENMKYKRDDAENMIIHLRCEFMAEWIKLNFDRSDEHNAQAYRYSNSLWDSFDAKKKAEEGGVRTDWWGANSRYQSAWVDGFFAAHNATEQSNLYYMVCEDDKLLFSEVVK